MRIIICIPVWNRPKIFEKVIKRINQIRDWSKSEIIVYCAGDFADECHQVFVNYQRKHDKYLPFKNRPVSNKFNHLFKQIKNIEFDYAAIIGSDDLISDKGWEIIETNLYEYKHHFLAFKDINFYDVLTGKAAYYEYKGRTQNRTVGCYRFLHDNLLKSLNYEAFRDGHNSGIDWTMEQKIQYFTNIDKKIVSMGNKGYMVDVKSGVNINTFQKLQGIFNMTSSDKWPKEILELLK